MRSTGAELARDVLEVAVGSEGGQRVFIVSAHEALDAVQDLHVGHRQRAHVEPEQPRHHRAQLEQLRGARR